MQIRRLNSEERFFYFLEKWFNFSPILKATLKGEIDVALLKQSLVLVQSNHKLLNVIIKQVNLDVFFYSGTKPIEITVLNKKNASQWQQEAFKISKKKFDVKNGPLIKAVFLFSPENNLHDLILIGHHSIIDFQSVLILFRDLIKQYRLLKNDGKIISLVRNKVNEIVNSDEQDIASNSFGRKWFPSVTCHVFEKIFDEKATDKIKNFIKKENATWLSFFSMMIRRAIKSNLNKEYAKISLPINLRGILEPKPDEEVGCHISLFSEIKSPYCENDEAYNVTAQYKRFFNRLFYNFIKNFSKNKMYAKQNLKEKIYYSYLIIDLWVKNKIRKLFRLDHMGFMLINNGGDLSWNKTEDDFYPEEINWTFDSTMDERKNSYLNFVILNNKLNITFTTTLAEKNARKIFEEFVGEFENRIDLNPSSMQKDFSK